MPITVTLPNNWRPRRYQMPAWKYLQGGGRHAELVWHRRAGKDDLALHWTAVSSYQRAGNYWHMLPRANQARKALWEAVNPHTGKRRIDEAFPPALRTGFNDHEMVIRLSSGASWQVVGSDNFDSLVGSPPVGLVFSEWALCSPASWAYLRPIVAENKGWVIFNTTPRGRNHAYKTFAAAKDEMARGEDVFAQALTVEQTDVFTKETLEKEHRNLIAEYGREFGQSVYEQEYMCSFNAANLGAILGRWLARAENEGRIGEFEPDYEGAPLEISSDIGFRDTASWWFWQPALGGFTLLANDSESGLDADDWIDRLKDKAREIGLPIGRIWLPNDAKAKTFATSHSAMERFLQAFGSDKVRAVPATKKLDQINAARFVIERCRFNQEACKEGIEGLIAWKFEFDEETNDYSKEPLHDWASHHGDSFSYGALMMRERVEKIKEKEKPRVMQVGGEFAEYGAVTLNDMWREHEKRINRRVRI